MERASLYVRLRTDLVNGTFAADSLLVEGRLATLYGVSRTPVREALARLEQEGLIVRAVRGFQVNSGTPQDVIEIYEVRSVLEQTAAAAAAVGRTELQLAELTQLHREAEAAGDPAIARARNSAWHELLWGASQNTTLEAILRGLVARLRIFDRESDHRDDLAEALAEHSIVLAAIRDRDAEAAGAAMAAHLDRTKRERLESFARRRVGGA
ncbi:GntR family transcriptional regulator [Agromyces endophyticus]|uniref:GntR family transcriptional regulator n=1 Tax=Agromyces sp. H17E-10 TaxID=2932244 RepID=UPI001FCF9075|nr:GntR family transcriptional regulator [Agromyces sp. H17E-10]UOQ89137.1 GntR family transcriptional regulator [Agromyces sp. H17E-10]